MDCDNYTEREADEAIEEAKREVAGGADPSEVLLDNFGLEPDYFMDIMP